jgi:hypothetical protein
VLTTTGVAIAALGLSLGTAGAGAWLLQRAYGMPFPAEPARRAIAGTVVEVLATPCPSRRRPGTCWRPVANFMDGGASKQAAARGVYRPAPLRKGDPVTVLVEADGTAWLQLEWDARQARRVSDHESARRFPLLIGWLLVGCGAFGVLLAAGLVFFGDRSEPSEEYPA